MCFGNETDQYRATWGLAALGFPNGAESGAMNGNLSSMEHLHVRVTVRVMGYFYANTGKQST